MSAILPIFCHPVYSDQGLLYTPQVSGGSYVVTLPLTNVLTLDTSQVARTSDATAASSKFVLDLGVARPVRGLWALLPNISKSGATVRWRGSSSSSDFSSGYSSGNTDAWPSGVTIEDTEGAQIWHYIITASDMSYRYWEFQGTDTANADGHIDIAHVAVCGGIQFASGVSYGARFGIDDEATIIAETEARQLIVKEGVRLRTELLTFKNVSETLALTTFRRMQRKLGKSRRLFYCYNPADTALGWERAFPCTMRELPPVEHTYADKTTIQAALTEVV